MNVLCVKSKELAVGEEETANNFTFMWAFISKSLINMVQCG